MSFLEKLLDGAVVEWKTLGEVAKVQRGASPRPIAQYITDDIDGIPWIKIGDTSLGSKYVKNTSQKITIEGAKKSRVLKKGDFIISNSMSFGRPYILDIDGAIHDGWASISNFEGKVNSDFLYYYLSSNSVQNYWLSKINSGSVSNLNADIIKTLLIPIPCPENSKKSFEIQAEIVHILDAFSAMTVELTVELNTRKKQYNYYRDQLFNFEESEVEWRKLGDVVSIKHGKDWKSLGAGDIPVYGSGGVMQYVDTFTYDKPTVLIPRKGSITNIFYVESPFWNVDTIYYTEIDTKQIIPKFFYYFMKTIDLMQLDTGSGRPSLTQAILNEIKVPIPHLDKQAHIVKVLDKFDALTSSITDGLPREIELRQQQYEYYRDLLFSFPKPETVAV